MDTVEEFRAGIDWVSMVIPSYESEAQEWFNIWCGAIITVGKGGNRIETRTINGYAGVMAGGCFCGSREDGIYVQLSGSYADELFFGTYSPLTRITRIDLQVTVKFTSYVSTIGEVALSGATIANETLPSSRRRRLLTYAGNDGGYTLYIGAPSSEQRGRIYNKDVQSSDPAYERTWRYETVFRDKYAQPIAERCFAAQDRYRAYIVDAVALWYHERGVSTPFAPEDYEGVLPKIRTAPTDIERQLSWLSKQVGPCVRRLVEQGYGDVVHSLLYEGVGQAWSTSFEK